MSDWVQKQMDRIRQEQDEAETGEKGGPGSGHYGHAGRPGKRGGSQPGKGGGGGGGGEEAGAPPRRGGGGRSARAEAQAEADDVVSYATNRDLYKPDYKVEDGYYKPDQPIEIHIRGESRPTNAWYGSSQIYRPDYDAYVTEPDDVIAKLPGGNFLLRGGKGELEAFVYTTSDKSPFERTYGQAGTCQWGP